jgi:SAM-dependent methyltransferase
VSDLHTVITPVAARYHGIFAQLKMLNIYENSLSEDLYGQGLADFYDRFVGSFVGDIPVFERYLPAAPGRVLDLACGSGRIGIALARLGAIVDGIDLSPHMLDRVRTNIADESPEVIGRLSFQQGDITNFSMRHQYDLIIIGVTSISLLLTAEERKALFDCVAAHLTSTGKLIFDIMDFSEGRWKAFDNYQEVWSREVDEGQDFAIVGQKFYPDERIFCFNVYREFIDWGGETSRTIGSSTKAWLERDELIAEMRASGIELVEDFRLSDSRYFVAKLMGSE